MQDKYMGEITMLEKRRELDGKAVVYGRGLSSFAVRRYEHDIAPRAKHFGDNNYRSDIIIYITQLPVTVRYKN